MDFGFAGVGECVFSETKDACKSENISFRLQLSSAFFCSLMTGGENSSCFGLTFPIGSEQAERPVPDTQHPV